MAEVKPSLFKSFGHTPIKRWMVQAGNGDLRRTFFDTKSDAKHHLNFCAAFGSKGQQVVRVEIRVAPKRRAKKGRK